LITRRAVRASALAKFAFWIEIVTRDLCLRCMLLLGIAACGDTSKMLDDAISEIDV
jgi:hypothetical protein